MITDWSWKQHFGGTSVSWVFALTARLFTIAKFFVTVWILPQFFLVILQHKQNTHLLSIVGNGCKRLSTEYEGIYCSS